MSVGSLDETQQDFSRQLAKLRAYTKVDERVEQEFVKSRRLYFAGSAMAAWQELFSSPGDGLRLLSWFSSLALSA